MVHNKYRICIKHVDMHVFNVCQQNTGIWQSSFMALRIFKFNGPSAFFMALNSTDKKLSFVQLENSWFAICKNKYS